MELQADTALLVTLGAILLLAVGLRFLARRTRLPTVTLLLLLGVAVGPVGLDLLPPEKDQWLPTVADIALVMVGFLMGGEFTGADLRQRGMRAVVISASVSVATALLVGLALWVLGTPPAVAILLGAIAPATAPAGTMAVVEETGADGAFAHELTQLVALDDVWEILLFSLAMAGASATLSGAEPWTDLLHGMWEIGGSLVLGTVLGGLAAPLTGRLQPGEPTLLEALGLVFLCAGLGRLAGFPPLLAAVVMGSVIANFASHHERAFHEIEHIEWPFLVPFFVLAGASADPGALSAMGLVPVAYVVARIAGRFAGVSAALVGLGAWDRTTATWTPLALLPQAGLALGLGLMVCDRFPDLADQVLPVILITTVLFEFLGPPLTRMALVKAGEVPER